MSDEVSAEIKLYVTNKEKELRAEIHSSCDKARNQALGLLTIVVFIITILGGFGFSMLIESFIDNSLKKSVDNQIIEKHLKTAENASIITEELRRKSEVLLTQIENIRNNLEKKIKLIKNPATKKELEAIKNDLTNNYTTHKDLWNGGIYIGSCEEFNNECWNFVDGNINPAAIMTLCSDKKPILKSFHIDSCINDNNQEGFTTISTCCELRFELNV